MKYRKIPVIIEAFQMTKDRRKSNEDWPIWLCNAWRDGVLFPEHIVTSNEKLYIKTLEGNHLVSLDDFIIQGVKGELYPCKPDIFHLTYEKVLDV